jgi:2-polyprenyl-3-methyl-5-hydroxy-6-metoxy-1,4-benzoquinol methylase
MTQNNVASNQSLNPKNWERFFKKPPNSFNDIMNESTILVGEKLLEHHLINKTNQVLDFGCGPGFLIDHIKNDTKSIMGVDISETYIETCKEKFRDNPNLTFQHLTPYNHVQMAEIISSQKIDTVIILSILQYYNSKDEVIDLILHLKKASENQKFKCIIADLIPENHSFMSDVKDLVFHAIKKRYILTLVKFILYTFNSDYSKFKKSGMLQLDYDFFEKIAKENQIKIYKTERITLHSQRYNICLDFSA